MKFSITYPAYGTTKMVVVDDDNKCKEFFERKMGEEVPADRLGDEFKGYVFRITGGFDKDGFAMKQGIFANGRIRLLLSPGAKGYRCKRSGERKRKSVRGCIVGPDINMLSVVIAKKGDTQIPGLTDVCKPKRLGPKRASGIRKLFEIEKKKGDENEQCIALIKSKAIKRTFKSKANPNAPERHKAPKIQRLVTETRLRRKRLAKKLKMSNWKRSIEALNEYKKLHSDWTHNKKTNEAKKLEEIAKAHAQATAIAAEAAKKVAAASSKKTAATNAGKTTKGSAPASKGAAPEPKKVPEVKETKVIIESNNKEITGAHVKAAITKKKTVVKIKQ